MAKKIGHAISTMDFGMFTLPEACSKGCEEQVLWWLARLERKPAFRLQPAERSPLHAASMHGHAGCVELLLECGSFKVDETDQGGATAMAYACENGYLDVVQLLSSYGARRTHLRDAMGGYFAFEAAAGHSHIVQWLAKTRDWCTPLHHASVLPVARVINLLRAGAPLHQRKRDPTKLCVSPLELAREQADTSEACRLVVLASLPWSALNHHLFPNSLRCLAKWLALLGHRLCQRHGRQLADLWSAFVMPMVIDRQYVRYRGSSGGLKGLKATNQAPEMLGHGFKVQIHPERLHWENKTPQWFGGKIPWARRPYSNVWQWLSCFLRLPSVMARDLFSTRLFMYRSLQLTGNIWRPAVFKDASRWSCKLKCGGTTFHDANAREHTHNFYSYS